MATELHPRSRESVAARHSNEDEDDGGGILKTRNWCNDELAGRERGVHFGDCAGQLCEKR